MSSNQIAQSMSFQERLKEKLRDDIAGLLTDEELKQIIERTFDEMFFKPIEIKVYSNYGGVNYKREEPLCKQFVTEIMEKQVKEVMKQVLAERKEQIDKMIEDLIKDGISKLLLQVIDEYFKTHLTNLKFAIQTDLQNIFQNNTY